MWNTYLLFLLCEKSTQVAPMTDLKICIFKGIVLLAASFEEKKRKFLLKNLIHSKQTPPLI